jgi:polysaccharide biosynthesis protein PslG
MFRRTTRCLSGALLLSAAGMGASAHGILLGVNGHFINYPAVQPHLLDLAQRMGADSVRVDTAWKFVETSKGVFKIPPAWDQFVAGARMRGIEPLAILCYGNRFYDNGKLPRSREAIAGFARYAAFVARHFAGRVRYYEVWNEWNTGTGGFYPGGSARDYARLFDATYLAIKRVDPSAVVLAAAGYHDWYARIAELGVAARADGVAIHPYVQKELDYRMSIGSNGPERSVQRVIEAESIMRRFSGRQIPLYITEMGWSTAAGARGYPEGDVAAMAERCLLMFSALPYVRGVWWYDLIDDGPDAANVEERFGLFRQNYAWKPAANVVQSIAPLLRHNDLTWNPASRLDAGLVVLAQGSSARPSLLAWHVHPATEDEDKAEWSFAVSCGPSQRVGRTADLAGAKNSITPMPSVFTDADGRCAREPLLRNR